MPRTSKKGVAANAITEKAQLATMNRRRKVVNGGQPLPAFKNSDEAVNFAEEHLRRLAGDAALEIEYALKFETSSKERTATAFKILGIGGVTEKQDINNSAPPLVLNFGFAPPTPLAADASGGPMNATPLPWLARQMAARQLPDVAPDTSDIDAPDDKRTHAPLEDATLIE